MPTLATDVLREVFAPSESPAPLRPIRAALAGLGRHGLAHAAVLSSTPNCDLVGLVDARRIARREAHGLGFRATGFARVEKMLDKLTPESVVVSATYPGRVAAARAVLNTGAHVLVEHPLELTAADAGDLIALAAERECKLVFAMPLVHHTVFGQVPRILGTGVMGRIIKASGSVLASRMPEDLRAGARNEAPHQDGVLARLASSLLYVLVWFMGAPVSVGATWSRRPDQPEDEMSAILRLGDGTRVGLDASWQTAGYPRPATVIEIDAENGKLLVSDDYIELELSEGRGVFESGNTQLGPEVLPQLARFDCGGDALYVQDASFLSWVSGGGAPPDRADQVHPIFAIRDALYDSARADGAEKEITA